MTIYAIFHDGRRANTEDHNAHIHHVYGKKVTSLFKLEIRSQKDGLPPALHYYIF